MTIDGEGWGQVTTDFMWMGSFEAAEAVGADILREATAANAVQVAALYLSEMGMTLTKSVAGTEPTTEVRFLPRRTLANILEVRCLDRYGAYNRSLKQEVPVAYHVRLRPHVDILLRDISEAFGLALRENLEMPDDGILVVYSEGALAKLSLDPSLPPVNGLVWPSHLWSCGNVHVLRGLRGQNPHAAEMKSKSLALSVAEKLGKLHALRLSDVESLDVNRDEADGSSVSLIWEVVKEAIRVKEAKEQPQLDEQKSVEGRTESFSAFHQIDQLEADLSYAELCMGRSFSHNNLVARNIIYADEQREAFILPPSDVSFESCLTDIANFLCHAGGSHYDTSVLPHENLVQRFLVTYWDSRKEAERQMGVAPTDTLGTTEFVKEAFIHLPSFVKLALIRDVLQCSKSTHIDNDFAYRQLRKLTKDPTSLYERKLTKDPTSLYECWITANR